MTAEDEETFTMSGPNLCLADLRWLVQRCERFADDSTVHLHGRRDGQGPTDTFYEKIEVRGRRRD